MPDPRAHLENARRCESYARACQHEEERLAFERMAENWRRLARDADDRAAAGERGGDPRH